MTTLYRKYRPQKFSDIIGQNPIAQTLSNAVHYNRIGHAYLFTGPRGTGKTTMARILAKAVNCEKRKGSEPCLKCAICQNINEGRSLDIIEIDAASNTGVDNIRELREAVKLPPTQAKYKVYIIDEAHMLSTGAFNALLKTLEEPPAHVIFILATTEIHKVPETIISRCQRFDFNRFSMENIIKKLVIIAKEEKVNIEKEAFEMIALAAEGGMRDAESLLSQVMALEDKNITAKEVEEILGTTEHQFVEQMADFILEKNTPAAFSLIDKLSEGGHNLEIFNKALLNYLRQLMLVSVDPEMSSHFSFELTTEQIKKIKERAEKTNTGEILSIIDNFIEAQNKIKSSFIPQLPLEMATIKSILPDTKQNSPLPPENSSSAPENKKISTPRKQAAAPTSSLKTARIPSAESDPAEKNEEQPTEEKPQEQSRKISFEEIREKWDEILVAIKPLNHSLIAFLSNCQLAKTENNTITIATAYSFYKEKLSEPQNRLTIESVFDKILKSKVRIIFATAQESGIKMKVKEVIKKTNASNGNDSSLLSEALNLMGGKIVGI